MYNLTMKPYLVDRRHEGIGTMIGRKEEIGIITDCLESGRPEFVAVYGRRRVGKTFLVKDYFNDTFSFYATGVTGTNTRQQLRIFNEALTKYGCSKKTIPKDWLEAFGRLREILEREEVYREFRSGRRIVFLDELPWMDTPRSDFRLALDYFWNSWGSSQKDLILIICGSATSWIINNIVKNTGGFYNRLTRQIHLMPFCLAECEQMLEANGHQLTRKQIIESYMVFGGIPYYLNYLKPGLSIPQNIEALFFRENSPLRYEFNQLFASLFKNPSVHVDIIRALSKKRSGMTRSELLNTNGIPQGKMLSKCLEELEQCGFIRKYSDFTKAKNGCIFQLVDPLTLFHLHFIDGNRAESWSDFFDTPAYYNWRGLAFENVCLLHSRQIKNALSIMGVSSHEFRWESKEQTPGAQIDLIIDRKDDVINICEIKYSTEEFVIDRDYEQKLVHKVEAFRHETGTKKALWLTMITNNGIKKNQYSHVVANEVLAEDLFTPIMHR